MLDSADTAFQPHHAQPRFPGTWPEVIEHQLAGFACPQSVVVHETKERLVAWAENHAKEGVDFLLAEVGDLLFGSIPIQHKAEEALQNIEFAPYSTGGNYATSLSDIALNISSTNLTELHKTEGRLQMAFDHSAGAFVRSNPTFWWARKRCEISEKASGLAGVIPKIRARSTFWCGVGVWNHESRCWRCQCRSALRMVVIVKCGSPPQRRSREGQNPFRMGDLLEMPRPGLARHGQRWRARRKPSRPSQRAGWPTLLYRVKASRRVLFRFLH